MLNNFNVLIFIFLGFLTFSCSNDTNPNKNDNPIDTATITTQDNLLFGEWICTQYTSDTIGVIVDTKELSFTTNSLNSVWHNIRFLDTNKGKDSYEYNTGTWYTKNNKIYFHHRIKRLLFDIDAEGKITDTLIYSSSFSSQYFDEIDDYKFFADGRLGIVELGIWRYYKQK